MNKQQLANKIWASANAMRAKIDANEYKDYILGLIFYKFLSDTEINHLKQKLGWADKDLPDLKEDFNDPDMRDTINNCKENIGYFISYDNLFSTWLKTDADFSVSELSGALSSFENMISEEYKSVYGGIFKTLRTGLDKLGTSVSEQTKALKKLLSLIREVPTDGSQNYDVLGYIYEYLISKFAASAGKKAGEFYTPSEVAKLMSDIVAEHHRFKKQIEIYDPTSGSGSLLITIGKSIGRHISDPNSVKYYAQELKPATYNLTRMNLVMRGISPSNIETRCADSLAEDWPMVLHGPERGKALRVDAVVSNPPYSQHWSNGEAEYDSRFKDFGVAPKAKADYAFLLHELHHLKPDGIMTIVLPHGVLFRGEPEDGAEGQIRATLIEKNHIDAIIGLPPNIFFGTGIPTLIMVLKQHRDNDDVLIIDASKYYLKGKQNILRASDIKRISDAYSDRKDIPGFCRAVSRKEIRDNGYNLNILRYVDSSEQPEQFDIYATVYGAIPDSEIEALSEYWNALPSLRNELFNSDSDKPYSTATNEDVAKVIDSNSDVVALYQKYDDAFTGFGDWLHGLLIDNYATVNVPKVLDEIASDIFRRLKGFPLVDRYDAYQVLSDNWTNVTADLEMLQTEGLDAARAVETKNNLVKTDDGEIEVPSGMEGRIIPFSLVQREMSQHKLREIEDIERQRSDTDALIDELRDGLDEDEVQTYMVEDTDRLDKALVKKDSKNKDGEIESATLLKLKEFVRLWNRQTMLNKELRTARQELEEATIAAIKSLTDEQIAHLLHLKWIDPICEGIASLLPACLTTMEKSIVELDTKYAMPYTRLTADLNSTRSDFSKLVSDLIGDPYAIEGIRGLILQRQEFAPLQGLKVAAMASMYPQKGEDAPRVRFKGFDEPWKTIKARKLFKTFNERNRPDLPVLSAFQDNRGMAVREDSGYNISHDLRNEATYKHVLPGQFVMHLRSFQGGFAHSSVEGITSPAYTVFGFIDEDSNYDYFWKLIFMSKAFIKRLETITYGIRDGRSISFDEFLNLSFLVPSKAEQQKIAEFFQNLDRQIKCQSQILERLKRVKAACLDQMFV